MMPAMMGAGMATNPPKAPPNKPTMPRHLPRQSRGTKSAINGVKQVKLATIRNPCKMEERIRRILAIGMKAERELKQKTNANRTGLWFYDTAKKNLQRAKEIDWNKKSKKWKLV